MGNSYEPANRDGATPTPCPMPMNDGARPRPSPRSRPRSCTRPTARPSS